MIAWFLARHRLRNLASFFSFFFCVAHHRQFFQSWMHWLDLLAGWYTMDRIARLPYQFVFAYSLPSCDCPTKTQWEPKKTRNKIRRQQTKKKNLQEIKHTPLNINKTRKRNRKKRESFSRVGWNWRRRSEAVGTVPKCQKKKRVSWRIDGRLSC